jgi:PAS domain S-box-containing protein
MIFYQPGQEFAMLDDALNAGGMAWWQMELPAGTVIYSLGKITMLGYNRADVDKFIHYTDFTERLHPDDYQATMEAMRNHLEGKAPRYETQYRIRRKDNSYAVYYDRGKIVGRGNGDIAVAGIVLDVTANTRFEVADGKPVRLL